jgi:hypothetical protein
VNKLRTTGLLITRSKNIGAVLTEEKLDDTGARLAL